MCPGAWGLLLRLGTGQALGGLGACAGSAHPLPPPPGGDSHGLHHSVCGPLRGSRRQGEGGTRGPFRPQEPHPAQGLQARHSPACHRSLRSGRRRGWRQRPWRAQPRPASPSRGARAPRRTAREWASTSARWSRESPRCSPCTYRRGVGSRGHQHELAAGGALVQGEGRGVGAWYPHGSSRLLLLSPGNG